jgi:hypothetical protein
MWGTTFLEIFTFPLLKVPRVSINMNSSSYFTLLLFILFRCQYNFQDLLVWFWSGQYGFIQRLLLHRSLTSGPHTLGINGLNQNWNNY